MVVGDVWFPRQKVGRRAGHSRAKVKTTVFGYRCLRGWDRGDTGLEVDG